MPSNRTPLSDPRAALTALWNRSLEREHGFRPLEVEGEVPADLRGTLYRNGPALFELFGRRYSHAFEGDGAVSAVRLSDEGASGAVRITESRGLREERAAGRMLYSMSAPRLRRLWNAHVSGRQKNTANTSVVPWQGRLFALMEAGKPTEIAPESLNTIGETNLGGVVRGGFSAHPHPVASRGSLYNFGVRYGRRTFLDLYELPGRGAPRHIGAIELEQGVMLHDFIASDSYLVFLVSPVVLSLKNFMLQSGGFTELFEWKPELGTEVICVPIDDPESAVRFRADAFYQWHFDNARDVARGVELSFVHYPNFDSLAAIAELDVSRAPGTLHRALIDLRQKRLDLEQLDDNAVEFPRTHPDRSGREHRYTWLTTDSQTTIARWDHRDERLDGWQLQRGQVASEVVVAPRSAHELDGYLLSLVYDPGRDASGLMVLDAARFDEGPLCTAWFDQRIPVTFHGSWSAE